jgi:hypothetical protein
MKPGKTKFDDLIPYSKENSLSTSQQDASSRFHSNTKASLTAYCQSMKLGKAKCDD